MKLESQERNTLSPTHWDLHSKTLDLRRSIYFLNIDLGVAFFFLISLFPQRLVLVPSPPCGYCVHPPPLLLLSICGLIADHTRSRVLMIRMYPHRYSNTGCVNWLTRSYLRRCTMTASRSQVTQRHAVPPLSGCRQPTAVWCCLSSACNCSLMAAIKMTSANLALVMHDTKAAVMWVRLDFCRTQQCPVSVCSSVSR